MLYQWNQSDTKIFVPGQPLYFTEFATLVGPDKGRVVIDRVWFRVFGTITVATAAFNGYDVARLLSNVQVDSISQNRWALTGLKTRLMAMHFMGEDSCIEHADIAVGATQAVDAWICVPLTKRFVRRGKDTSLPADMLRQATVTCATLGAAQTGTTVLSAAALNVTVYLDWHDSDSMELKVEDIVSSQEFSGSSECLVRNPGLLHDVVLMREASTAGGDLINAVTDVSCNELGMPIIARQALVACHTFKRRIGNIGLTSRGAEKAFSPVRANLMLPIIAADEDTPIYTGKIVKSATFRVLGVPANCSLVTRVIMPANAQSGQDQMAHFGITQQVANQLRAKTISKTNRDIMDWDKKRILFMPKSLPLVK